MSTHAIPTLLTTGQKAGEDFASTFYPRFTRVEPQESDRLVSLLRTNAGGFDFDALNVFLRLGTFVGTDTAFRHVKATPPDYQWATSATPCELDRLQIIDCYLELFRQAVARCTSEGEINLPLSGGQDSRHILLELCRQRRIPDACWTVDIPWKPAEALIAAELAGKLGVPHRIFRPNGRVAAVETAKNALTDFSSTQHLWMAEAVLSGFARSEFLFDGIGGDVLSTGLFVGKKRFELLKEGRLDELVEDIVGPDEHVFGINDQSLFPRSRALEKVAEEFRKHLNAPDPVSSFYFWNRTRREIGCSPYSLLRHGCKTVHKPFLDGELSRFLSSLPPSTTLGGTLHMEAIARAYPEFVDIPYAPSVKTYQYGHRFFRNLAVGTMRHLLSTRCALISRRKCVARLLRSIVVPRYASEALFLSPQILYLTQLFSEAGD